MCKRSNPLIYTSQSLHKMEKLGNLENLENLENWKIWKILEKYEKLHCNEKNIEKFLYLYAKELYHEYYEVL